MPKPPRVSTPADARLANLLGALSTGLNDTAQESAGAAARLDGSAPAALIALLDFLPGGTVRDLSWVVGLTHSGAVRLVDRLVVAGLVARKPGSDARSRSISLTAAGSRLAKRVRSAREAALIRTVHQLRDRERATLTKLCERVIAEVARQRLEQRAGNRPPAGGALCRMCDFTACGRGDGDCPAAEAAATYHGQHLAR